jgi:hypothetical protein
LRRGAGDEKVAAVARRPASPDRGSFLREVNDTIEQTAERLGVHDNSWRFLCECGQPGCRETVELTLDEYDDLTAHGFLVAGEHRTTDAA